MAELLLELLSEEIPARMQARAAADLKRLVCDGLKAAGLDFENAEAFVTPRRLALCIDGIPEKQPDVRDERKGPKVDAPDQAIQGFLRSAGLTSLEQCEKRATPKGDVWVAIIEKKGRDAAAVLPGLIVEAIGKLGWPKSMRWAGNSFRWVRPLQSVLAVFDGARLDGKLDLGGAEIPFGCTTQGHRFMAPDTISVTSYDDYATGLERAFVMLDQAKRRQVIEDGLAKLAKQARLSVRDDPALLDEVTGLVEWPVVLLGSIDKEFMDLPAEVLTTAMRSHQKYFSLLKKDGSLAPRFALVSNMETKDGGKQIVAGNERVLRARLADARFFWDQDRKTTLASRTEKLGDIVFHARLGTLKQKTIQIEFLAGEIANYITGAYSDRSQAGARLAKADLVTGMVGEFPELQGVMGRYYALEDGEHPEVADAIRDHYSPQGPNDSCPTAPNSITVALADKIQTLVSFWTMDEKPTGSKDPYALRRAALGVIRLILENKLRVPLQTIFIEAFSVVHNPPKNKKEIQGWVSPGGQAIPEPVADSLLDFFADRLKVHLRGEGVRHDLIAAVFSPIRAGIREDDLYRLVEKVKILSEFLATDDGANLLIAYRRAANIVRAEGKKGWVNDATPVNQTLFQQKEESILCDVLSNIDKNQDKIYEIDEFRSYLVELSGLRSPVDAFFDKVTVNADEDALRSNRLKFMDEIRLTMDAVADFSQIEG